MINLFKTSSDRDLYQTKQTGKEGLKMRLSERVRERQKQERKL